jgi:hypothetical protein
MTDRSHPPFKKGDPRAKQYGQLGGRLSQEAAKAKANADPTTKGLLGELLTLTTSQWMDRLGLVEPSWDRWRVIGKVLDNLPLTSEEMTIYTELTGRTVVPSDLREFWCVAGRGSGKTVFLALQSLKAACRGYANVRGIPRVLLLGFVQSQAEIAFEYVLEFVRGDRELQSLITRQTQDSLTFAHGVRLHTGVSSYKKLRGYSVAAALCDEIAFWWNDATDSNPDVEIVRALRPALHKVPGSRLLAASTPFTEEGVLYDVHQKHYGTDSSASILVVKAPTLTLNPSFDAGAIEMAMDEDHESAASEYDVAWRVAGGTLVHPAAYDICVDVGIGERAPEPPLGNAYYTAAVDLSGGTGQDSAALSICHIQERDEPEHHPHPSGVVLHRVPVITDNTPDVCVQDLLLEIAPPFDPGDMVAQIAAACRQFGITEVVGDQFSEGFAAAEFFRHGIQYFVSARKTAECVLDSLAVINTQRVRLLDVPKMRKQYLNLRRDYGSGGRITVLETRRHDDLAVVTARGIVACLGLDEDHEVRPQLRYR